MSDARVPPCQTDPRGSRMVAVLMSSLPPGAVLSGLWQDAGAIIATVAGGLALSIAGGARNRIGQHMPSPPPAQPFPNRRPPHAFPLQRTKAAQAFDRRSMLQITGVGVVPIATGPSLNTATARAETMAEDWDNTFPKGDRVDQEKARLTNR